VKKTTFKKKLFGGEITIIVYGIDEILSKDIVNEMYSEALRLQKIFNFFDENSELSNLNRKRNMSVSNELLKVLKKSVQLSKFTKGNYDISLGRKILQRKKGEKEEDTLDSYKDIKISGNIVSIKNSSVIDLGSIAKGYITDCLGKFLEEKGIKEFLIDSRGDILVHGDSTHILGIQNPRENKKIIFSVKIKDKAIATSGDYNQFYDGFEKSHVINKKEPISATVIAKDLETADLIATCLLVSDNKTREKIMNKNKKARAFIVKNNMEEEYYNNFEEVIKR